VIDESLADTLLSLTDTGVGDFDPAVLLYVLTTASMRLLDADAAAVLLVDEHGRLVPVAATHDSSEQLEKLQVQVRQGPCLDCTETKAAVRCADLGLEAQRWPEFTRLAIEEGFRSAHAEPLQLRGEVVGAMNLLRSRPGLLSAAHQRQARQLATGAAIGLLHRRALHRLETVAAQLQGALDSRVEIEQAKGALVERHGLDPGVAFERMRSAARRRGMPLRHLAREVLDRRIDLT
jgi:transcriptional regulator with GAF, ATPase, and Fis domain